jgi:hypothetical protein
MRSDDLRHLCEPNVGAVDVGIFIHPVRAQPSGRSAKFALSQIAQYTVDTT